MFLGAHAKLNRAQLPMEIITILSAQKGTSQSVSMPVVFCALHLRGMDTSSHTYGGLGFT